MPYIKAESIHYTFWPSDWWKLMHHKYVKDKQSHNFWGHVANVAISIFYYATTYPLPLRTVLLVRLLCCTCSTIGIMPLACCLVNSFPYKRSASPSYNTFWECDINWRDINDSDSPTDALLFVRHFWSNLWPLQGTTKWKIWTTAFYW